MGDCRQWIFSVIVGDEGEDAMLVLRTNTSTIEVPVMSCHTALLAPRTFSDMQ